MQYCGKHNYKCWILNSNRLVVSCIKLMPSGFFLFIQVRSIFTFQNLLGIWILQVRDWWIWGKRWRFTEWPVVRKQQQSILYVQQVCDYIILLLIICITITKYPTTFILLLYFSAETTIDRAWTAHRC